MIQTHDLLVTEVNNRSVQFWLSVKSRGFPTIALGRDPCVIHPSTEATMGAAATAVCKVHSGNVSMRFSTEFRLDMLNAPRSPRLSTTIMFVCTWPLNGLEKRQFIHSFNVSVHVLCTLHPGFKAPGLIAPVLREVQWLNIQRPLTSVTPVMGHLMFHRPSNFTPGPGEPREGQVGCMAAYTSHSHPGRNKKLQTVEEDKFCHSDGRKCSICMPVRLRAPHECACLNRQQPRGLPEKAA